MVIPVVGLLLELVHLMLVWSHSVSQLFQIHILDILRTRMRQLSEK